MGNTDKNTDKRLKNLKPAWKKGDASPNPEGRPKGQKNYATLYKEALIKLAELNGKTPDELEIELVSKGITEARKGSYAFYRDIMDRLHGKPIQPTDLTSGGEKVQSIIYLPAKPDK